MKRAFLFDADGVLLDTWNFVFGGVEYNVMLHKRSYPSDEAIKKAQGRLIHEFYKVLLPGIDSQVLVENHMKFQEENLHLIKLFPKTKTTLKKLKSLGFLLGVISNRLHESLVYCLETTGILNYFDVLLAPEDVVNPKPHPDHILTALKQLGVKPKDAYVVGDTNEDILAGKNAKVKTVGVTYGFMGQEIKRCQPDYLINDIAELPRILR